MKSRIIARVKRLEDKLDAEQRVRYRIGVLKRLPDEFDGPRHTIVTSRQPIEYGVEWCEFEEQPGFGPSQDPAPCIYLTEADMRL